MTVLKNILARVLALWAMVTFILTFLIVFIPSMFCWLIPEPKGQKIFIDISRLWMSVWLRMVFCPFTIKGREHFLIGETYIVTCNHNSLLDVPLSCPFIPGANKTIAKSTFTRVPLFGFYYMKGSVLVNRNNEISRRQSFDKMKNILARKMHMSIYPEGTRNRTDQPLKKFHDGAFRLATDTNTAIIPAVIFNTKKVLPANKPFWFWPGKIELHFLEAIPVNGQTTEQLKEKVFAVMSDYYSRTAR
ncbi:MAG: lysophospholipid acyltransferase family protein [Chitinophagaceae bacterium]